MHTFSYIAGDSPRFHSAAATIGDGCRISSVDRNHEAPGRFVAQPAKLRESISILGPIGVLLGGDDVVESGDVHHDATDLLVDTAPPQHAKRDVSALSVTEFSQHVDRAGIGHPCRAAERTQGRRVELDRQLTRLVVGHAADTKSSTELAQRGGKAFEVPVIVARNAVDVRSRSRRSVCSCSKPSDEDVVDTVAIEGGQDQTRVEWRLSHWAEMPRDAG